MKSKQAVTDWAKALKTTARVRGGRYEKPPVTKLMTCPFVSDGTSDISYAATINRYKKGY